MPECNECKYDKVIDEHTRAIQDMSKTIEAWRPYMSKLIGILAVLGFLASAALNRVWDAVSGSSAHAATTQTTAAATRDELKKLVQEAAAEYIRAKAAQQPTHSTVAAAPAVATPVQ